MQLTDAMREWLGRQPGDTLLYDFVLNFRAVFKLTPQQAGRLLAKWINECC